jgi:FMN-dependent NADH-azoreductase
VWEEALPEFDGAALDAKYAKLAGRPHGGEEAAAWSEISRMVARLDDADAVLLSTPMWNFGIPYRLKHWIDLVTQPGLTFTFDPATGYSPLLRPRPVTVILASAGDYSSGPSWGRPDLASGYLEAALGFIGLGKPRIIRAGPTVGDPEAREQALARARSEIADAVAGADA